MKNKTTFSGRCKNLWKRFTTYEKIWFFSILVLAIVFSFLFPETDDPTYTVKLDKTAYSSGAGSGYTVLDFTGTEEDFVISGITVNGEEVDLGYDEYTVTPDEPETLKFNLEKAVSAEDEIEIECYPDGEGTVLHLRLCDGEGNSLFAGSVDLTESGSGYSVAQNPLNYIVPVYVITILYLLDVITNIACELMISKQSKWNFIISLVVEVIEILICILCAYRFATLATTLLFWIPCDIISFIVWNKHPDKEDKEVTEVKKLTVKQDILLILGIIVWTVAVGYALTFIDVEGGIFANNVQLKNIVCYLDACASALGIANGVFILLRYREQWIAWYLVALLETVINILAGQWILLVLKAGYLTNTTYGYIKWTKYIKKHQTDKPVKATEN
ncbi:MAG: nicotinamide riboside transporter PnuC [Eubacteriales bacterium]